MGFKERISLVLDVDSKGGLSGLKSFGSSVREADGFVGKFKAGASSAFQSAKENAGTMALAGGAALVAFGVKALGAFMDVAMGARDFGAATGLAVEDASRWIAIADDMGLAAEDLQAGFGMVSKSLDDKKWEKYGIATRDAGGRARDMNDIMLDTFDVLSKETNLTERARLGKELLGKGYANLAPLIGKSRKEYEEMLGSVEKGQVVTKEEAEKAQRMAKAQDALGDALNEVTLAFGEVVASAAPLIEVVAEIVTAVTPLIGTLGDVAEGIDSVDWSRPFESSDKLQKTVDAIEAYNKGMTEGVDVTKSAASSSTTFGEVLDRMVSVVDTSTEAQDEAAAAAERHRTQLDNVRQGIINYRTELENAAAGSFDLESAVLDLATSTADLAVKQQETEDILADSTLTDAEKSQALRELRQDQISTAEGALQVAKAYAESTGASDGTAESIQAQISALSMLKGQYPELSANIQTMIDKLLDAPGAFDPTGFEDIGSNIASGIGRGIDGSSYIAEDAARKVVNKAMQAAVAAGKIRSPSRLFAERVGEPIAAGIAKGIIDDSDRIDEALKRAIESAAKTALDETQTAVSAASTALSGFWNGIDDQRSEDALRGSVSDASNALSEAMRTGDYSKAADARERLRDANYRLAKSTQDMILVDDAARESWKATATAGGLSTQEIDGIIDATMRLTQAKADAAAQSDAINAEAAAAQETRSKFAAVVGNGLVTSGQIDALKEIKDPGAQLASMAQIVSQLEQFFAGVSGSQASAAGAPAAPSNVVINVAIAPGGSLVEAGRQINDSLAAFYRNGGKAA